MRPIHAAAVVALLGLGACAAWLLWRTQVPGDLELPRVALQAARADEYARLPRVLWVGRTVAELLVLAGLVAAGPWLARRLRFGVAVLLAVLAALGAAAILLQPLVAAPRLEPLRNRALAADIRELGTRLGVRPRDVSVKDAAERTTRINAEVVGYGPTLEVVLWDTLLDGRVPAAEIRFIAAHELAHVARRHVWKGVAWFALLATPIAFAIAKATRRRGGLGEPAVVPLAVLAAVGVQLALLPFANAVSRRYEAEADWVALQATRDPTAARGLFERFATTNLASPSPPSWSYVLLATHPSLDERIALAEAWRVSRRASRGGS